MEVGMRSVNNRKFHIRTANTRIHKDMLAAAVWWNRSKQLTPVSCLLKPHIICKLILTTCSIAKMGTYVAGSSPIGKKKGGNISILLDAPATSATYSCPIRKKKGGTTSISIGYASNSCYWLLSNIGKKTGGTTSISIGYASHSCY